VAAPDRRPDTDYAPSSDPKSGQKSGTESGRSSGKDQASQDGKAGNSSSGIGLRKRSAAPVADEESDEPAPVSKSDKVLRGGALFELSGQKSSAAGLKPQGGESAPNNSDRQKGESRNQPTGDIGQEQAGKKTNAAQLRGAVDNGKESNKAGFQYRSSKNAPLAPVADGSDKAEGRATSKPASLEEGEGEEDFLRRKAKLAKPDAYYYKGLQDRKPGAATDNLSEVEFESTDSSRELQNPDARRWKSISEIRGRYGRRDLAADAIVITGPQQALEQLRNGEGDGANPIADLGTEAYTPIVENSFLPAYENPLSTFGVDVDTASYSNVRRFLNKFQLPPRDAVRIEELVNYFSYSYPQPTGEQPVSVSVDAANCPWNPTNQLVRVGLKGKEIPRDKRPPSNFVFLVDVSGSMQAANKLPLVQKGLNLLTDQMAETDQVGIVTYADRAVQRLETTNGTNKTAIHQVINSLQAGGSTNGADGIRLAYDAAARHFIAGGSNRVILCTDGDFNVGITGDALVEFVQDRARSKVFSTVLGFGMGNVKDGFLEKLADKGNGQYAYIDREEEARKVFVEDLSGTLTTIAKDVKLQIEFNPNQVGSYRLLGYENRVMPAADFKNDKIDAGDMGAGHTVTALYEIVPPAAAPKSEGGNELRYRNTVVPQEGPLASELLTVRLRYKLPEADTSRLSEYPIGNTTNVLAVSNGAGTPLEYSVRLQRLAPEDAAVSLRSFFVAGNPDSPVIEADSRSRILMFRGNSDQVAESQKRLADRGEKLEPASRDLNWAAAVAAFGLILRDSEYRGQANFDMVLELATAAKGDDPTGRRQEFITLVQRAREIVNQRSEGRVVRLLSKISDAEREQVATVDGKYSNLLRIVAAPDDVAAYGSMREFGRWEGTVYAGQKDLPQGFWVYVYPNWYIWGNTAK
jgi:secreted protein with Ig-like and vWFA domain